jgi:hypothetical protein
MGMSAISVSCGYPLYRALKNPGGTVGALKSRLERLRELPYFCRVRVNRQLVGRHYVLGDGDRVDFYRCFAFKAGRDDQSSVELAAEALLDLRPHLLEFGKKIKSRGLKPEIGFATLLEMVRLDCEEMFGPFPSSSAIECATIAAVTARLLRPPDGPEEGRLLFWWQGKSFDIRGATPHALLKRIWRRKSVLITAAEDDLWPKGRQGRGALKKGLFIIRELLRIAEVPWTYGEAGRYIVEKKVVAHCVGE